MSQNAEESTRESVSIRYAGPALEAHSMDVRQLAPSLLALADVFVIAHGSIGPTLTPPPALEVTAQRGGSFIVDLMLSNDVSDDLIGLLNSAPASAAANADGIAGPVVFAVSWLIARRRKGRETQVSPVDPGTVRIWWPDGTTMEAPVAAQELVERMDFARTAAQVFEPLRRDGIDRVELEMRRPGRGGPRTVSVEQEDLRAFNLPPQDDTVLSDNIRVVTIRIENAAFKPGNKWRVHDGAASMWASLDDRGFVQRMQDGIELFGVGDLLVVQMRDQQVRSDDGITVEHSIQRVIEHKSAPPPDELVFPDDTED